MKPASLSLGLALVLLCAPLAQGHEEAAQEQQQDQQELIAPPPSEADLETPFVHIDDGNPNGIKKVFDKLLHPKKKYPRVAPPPIQSPKGPKAPRAFGDFFRADGAEGEPTIPEAKPLITNAGSCQAESVEFDACPNSWFFVAPGGAKNKFNLTQDEILERDHIYSLAALAVVNEDWQFAPEDAKTNPEVANLPRRGHNIGGVLVDNTGKLVWWERNSNGVECSGTNHGETRMMISYLKFARRSTLPCHTIYTSLEPCAMCSGMMVQQKIARTLYVQKDHGFGAAIERLHQPYTPRKFDCGFPRAPFSRHAEDVKASKDLDVAFHIFMNTTGADDLTAFLQTKRAKEIYQSAVDELLAFKPKTANEQALKDAKTLVAELRSPIYKRSYVTVDQHVQIERSRRAQQTRVDLPRLGLPLEIDACCRPPLMSNLGRIGQGVPLSPACKAESPVLTPVPQLK